MSTAFTFYFNEIFPDYASWKKLVEGIGIVDYNDTLQSEFDKFCFKLLSRRYTHCNIRYDTPDAFVCELMNVYENKFQSFKRQKELIDAIYKLSNEELTRLNETLNNMANNPNTEPDNPLEPLKYISAQTYAINKSNRMQSYLYALENIPTLNVYKFYKADNDYDLGFDDLFMSVQPIQIPLYKQGGN